MVRVRDIGSKILHMRNLNRKDTGYIQFTEDNGVSIFLLPINGFILKSTTTSDLLHRNRDWNAKAPRLDIPHCCRSRAVKVQENELFTVHTVYVTEVHIVFLFSKSDWAKK